MTPGWLLGGEPVCDDCLLPVVDNRVPGDPDEAADLLVEDGTLREISDVSPGEVDLPLLCVHCGDTLEDLDR